MVVVWVDLCGHGDSGQKGLILMHGDEYSKKIVKMIGTLSNKHSTWQVFSDFVEVMAITLSNAVDKLYFEEREEQYFKIMGRYQTDEFKQFGEMFALLILALEECTKAGQFEDVLGRIFHELELHNKYKGQFFTPQSICNFMGQLISDDGLGDKIADKGYVTLYEPACGSGAMVLGWLNGIRKQGFDWSTQVCATAVDIDLKCVHMAYVQLTLYGIPAVVIHGDNLSRNEWSKWYTPAYLLGGWHWRESYDIGTEQWKDQGVGEQIDPVIQGSDFVSEASQIVDNRPEVVFQAPEFGFGANGQMTLF